MGSFHRDCGSAAFSPSDVRVTAEWLITIARSCDPPLGHMELKYCQENGGEQMDYQAAVEEYRRHCTEHGLIFEQPSASHSRCEVEGWVLANVNGVLFDATDRKPVNASPTRKIFVDIVGHEVNYVTQVIEVPVHWTDEDVSRLSGVDLDHGWGDWDIDGTGGMIVYDAIRVGPTAPENAKSDWVLSGDPPKRHCGEHSATEPRFERQAKVRQRLLTQIVPHLNERAIDVAVDGLRDLLTDVPEIAEELLAPIFERSEYWPSQIAKAALGLSSEHELDADELLQRCELRAEG